MGDAKTIYDNLVRQIDADCARSNCGGTLSLCETLEMQSCEKPYGAMGQHYVFDMVFPNGDRLDLSFKWYDKPKPLSIQPDIHKFHVTYTPKEGNPLSHSHSYEE